MINRQNWLDCNAFLTYQKEVALSSSDTVKRYQSHLNHMLVWADDTSLAKAASIRPTLPAHLTEKTQLALATIRRTLATATAFANWCMDEIPSRYQTKPTTAWVKTLRIPKFGEKSLQIDPYTCTEVETFLTLPRDTNSFTRFRDQAAVAMLFASGMRIDALVTMPIHCASMETHPPELKQWPSLGVRTKFSKAATTFLAAIPTLMPTIMAWDTLVRTELPQNALWYAGLSTDGTKFTRLTVPSKTRDQQLRHGLNRLCQDTGIPYRHPHMLRHGHAIYVKAHSLDPNRDDAIRYNLMHSPGNVTQIYTAVSESMARNIYNNLSYDGSILPDAALNSMLAEMFEQQFERIQSLMR